VVERWEDFWLDHRGDYVTLTGTRRLAATLVETRYGRWLEHTFRNGVRLMRREWTPGREARARALTTGWLVLAGLLGGYPIAFVLGAIAALRRYRPSDVVMLAMVAGVVALGTVGGSALLVNAALAARPLVPATLVIIAVTAAFASRHQRAVQSRALELVHLRTERAFGASALRIVLRSARLTGAGVAGLAAVDLPALLTASFVVERAFSLSGVGEVMTGIVRSGNLTSLMAFALLFGAILAVARVAADLLLRWLDPRVSDAPARARGVVR
jgi:ABC-type dipeptide/oligopeptide/nickel transport system permease component